jgi:folate-dependent phosphoribosylglycinamide formyltransferase PurN
MSGSGTNVRKIIEHQKKLESEGKATYEVVAIFTDNPNWSNARVIADEYDIPLKAIDIKEFYGEKKLSDMKIRELYDCEILKVLQPFDIDAIALAGYAWIVTSIIHSKYLVVNVHPADLSKTENGKRKYSGLHWRPPAKAILAGEKEMRGTTHIVTDKLDYGEILIISKPLKIELPAGITVEELKRPENESKLREIAEKHQNELKKVSDWEIFPLTLQWIAEGRFAMDENRVLYLDGKAIPNGFVLK